MLPAKIKQQRPALLLAQAWTLHVQFRLLQIPPILERVERLLAEESEHEALRAEMDSHRGRLQIHLQGDAEGALKRLEEAKKRDHRKLGRQHPLASWC